MNEKEFIESQKECAAMLGMSLTEYQEYCNDLKVPIETPESEVKNDQTLEILKFLGINKNKLKHRKEK